MSPQPPLAHPFPSERYGATDVERTFCFAAGSYWRGKADSHDIDILICLPPSMRHAVCVSLLAKVRRAWRLQRACCASCGCRGGCACITASVQLQACSDLCPTALRVPLSHVPSLPPSRPPPRSLQLLSLLLEKGLVIDELDPRAPQRGGETHRQRRRSGAPPDELLSSAAAENSASWMGLCRTRSSPRAHRMDIKASACN